MNHYTGIKRMMKIVTLKTELSLFTYIYLGSLESLHDLKLLLLNLSFHLKICRKAVIRMTTSASMSTSILCLNGWCECWKADRGVWARSADSLTEELRADAANLFRWLIPMTEWLLETEHVRESVFLNSLEFPIQFVERGTVEKTRVTGRIPETSESIRLIDKDSLAETHHPRSLGFIFCKFSKEADHLAQWDIAVCIFWTR